MNDKWNTEGLEHEGRFETTGDKGTVLLTTADRKQKVSGEPSP